MKRVILNSLMLSFLFITNNSCTKQDFLNARPDQAVAVPSTLDDFQAMLDNDIVMNGAGNYGIVPAFGEVGADDYYITEETYSSILSPLYRNCYIWAANLYSGEEILDWDFPYRAVFYSNVVLDGLSGIDAAGTKDEDAWNNEKGSALFYRAFMFYQLAQVFASPYEKNTAGTALGIPLRLKPDVNEPIQRSTLAETYQRIIQDLQEASALLPPKPKYKTRPSRPAAYALLARTYQSMQLYDKALVYADSCLQLQNELLDYNSFDTEAIFPFERFNEEVIFNCTMQSTDVTPVAPGIQVVDSTLYHTYHPGDLRLSLYFKDFGSGPTFVGNYNADWSVFAGLATDEIYFIRAECFARQGNIQGALEDLNKVMSKRWKTGMFVPFRAETPENALLLVLQERRKELLMRGLRWTDLRRLNQDERFTKTLTRKVGSQVFSLPPDDPRYVFPIPDNVTDFNPSIQQNPR